MEGVSSTTVCAPTLMAASPVLVMTASQEMASPAAQVGGYSRLARCI